MLNITTNERAFLRMIIRAESTDRNVHTGEKLDPYRTCFDYSHTIVSLAEHPAMNPLEHWDGCHYSRNGSLLLSTAAGAYQINRPTWKDVKPALQLKDFDIDSQDAAALWLVKRAHASELVRRGQLRDAIIACNDVWASFAGSSASNQPQRSWDFLSTEFVSAGGALV